jgi:hypothetical protein
MLGRRPTIRRFIGGSDAKRFHESAGNRATGIHGTTATYGRKAPHRQAATAVPPGIGGFAQTGQSSPLRCVFHHRGAEKTEDPKAAAYFFRITMWVAAGVEACSAYW